jgi:subtilase family serine protease
LKEVKMKGLKQILGVLLLLFIIALFLLPVDSEAQIKPQKRYMQMKKPDLSVAIIDPPPSAQPVSTHILSSIKIRIENIGKASTVDSFYVYLFLTKGKVSSYKQLILHVPLKSHSWNANPIGDGCSVTHTVHNLKSGIPDNLAPGLYYLGVTVDQKNKIDEINEKNNSTTLQIEIEGISISSVHQTCDYSPGICVWLMGKGFGSAGPADPSHVV